MQRRVGSFASDRSGNVAIEYGVLAMAVGFGLVLVLEGIGVGLEGAFAEIKTVFLSAVLAASR